MMTRSCFHTSLNWDRGGHARLSATWIKPSVILSSFSDPMDNMVMIGSAVVSRKAELRRARIPYPRRLRADVVSKINANACC